MLKKYNNYKSSMNNTKLLSTQLRILDSFSNYSVNESNKLTEEYDKIIKQLKGYYRINLAISSVMNIAVVCGSVLLQKRLLNSNAEESI